MALHRRVTDIWQRNRSVSRVSCELVRDHASGLGEIPFAFHEMIGDWNFGWQRVDRITACAQRFRCSIRRRIWSSSIRIPGTIFPMQYERGKISALWWAF